MNRGLQIGSVLKGAIAIVLAAQLADAAVEVVPASRVDQRIEARGGTEQSDITLQQESAQALPGRDALQNSHDLGQAVQERGGLGPDPVQAGIRSGIGALPAVLPAPGQVPGDRAGDGATHRSGRGVVRDGKQILMHLVLTFLVATVCGAVAGFMMGDLMARYHFWLEKTRR